MVPAQSENMNHGQKLIHISGASGSGKTTLGKKITELYGSSGVMVVEIDLYLQPYYEDAKHFLGLDNRSPEYKQAWEQYLTDKFTKTLDENQDKPIIVFVGLLDQLAPIAPEGFIPPDYDNIPRSLTQQSYSNYRLFFECTKLYLDVPLEANLSQFYRRLICEDGSLDGFWEGVRDNDPYIPSSLQVIENYYDWRDWYDYCGYSFCTDAQILDSIHTMLM